MTTNIPFEEVQAIIEHGDEAQNGSIEIVNQLRDKGLNIAPPKPSNPTTGLLGRWVKHEDHGDVLIISDWASDTGIVEIVWKDHLTGEDGSNGIYTHIDSLTFPEETTRPEEVPVGEAWLVDIRGDDGPTRTNAIKIVGGWATGQNWGLDIDDKVVLISPLVPAAEPEKPRTVTTEAEYAALPAGSIVVEEGIAAAIAKKHNGQWSCTGGFAYKTEELSGITRTVLREGWGDE